LVEQLRAPSVQRAVAFPNELLMHAAGCTMSSSEQTFVPFLIVRDGRPGSPTGEGLGEGEGDGEGDGVGDGDGAGPVELPTIVMRSRPATF
jgi:hypothetical protein